jgi:3-phosphoshikimate 1-carboxyvinyltransferase
MGLAADAPVKIDDATFIATSFPDFVPMMRRLGGEIS